MKIKSVQMIDVSEWDDLVTKTYGKPYNFQQQDDCKERGIHNLTVPSQRPYDYKNATVPEVINGREMGVSFSAWLARDPQEWNGKPEDSRYLDMFWERNFYPNVDMIANDLHARGLLPAGDYCINIDW